MFNFGIIRIILKIILVKNKILFYFWNLLSQIFGFFFLEFSLFFPFFHNNNYKVRKIRNQKHMLVLGGGGEIKFFKPKISPKF